MSIEFRDDASGHHLAKPLFRSGKKYGLSFQFVPLESKVIFVFTHFNHGRTTPCKGERCPICEEQPKRERAYIAVVHASRKMAGVLEITAKAGKELQAIALGSEIVGMLMKIERVAGKEKGSLIISPSDQYVTLNKFKKDWTTVGAICAVWGVDDPTTPKIALDPEDPRVSGDFAADTFKMNNDDGEDEETDEDGEGVAA